eukprot:5469563-Prymnesium_polylepis.2
MTVILSLGCSHTIPRIAKFWDNLPFALHRACRVAAYSVHSDASLVLRGLFSRNAVMRPPRHPFLPASTGGRISIVKNRNNGNVHVKDGWCDTTTVPRTSHGP